MTDSLTTEQQRQLEDPLLKAFTLRSLKRMVRREPGAPARA
jgi:hypothetical protein